MSDDEKKRKLVMLRNRKEDTPLTPEELEFKARLEDVQQRLVSAEKVMDLLRDEHPETIFDDLYLGPVLTAILLSMLSDIVADFFGLPDDHKPDIIP